mgnify:FL=1
MSSVGTDLKINVSIDRLDGYKMSDIDFTCDFYVYTNRRVTMTKEQMVKADDDNYVALVDSSKLGTGTIRCRVTAHIPDADFDDGIRTEIEEVNTGITIVR